MNELKKDSKIFKESDVLSYSAEEVMALATKNKDILPDMKMM